jgi:phospholipid-translocating ATPase
LKAEDSADAHSIALLPYPSFVPTLRWLPVIFMGVFEKDLSASTLLAVPELYTKGQRNGGFNIRVYLGWMFMASSEAMVVYFLMLGLWGQAKWTVDESIFPAGVITYTAIVTIIALKMQ